MRVGFRDGDCGFDDDEDGVVGVDEELVEEVCGGGGEVVWDGVEGIVWVG